MCPSHGCSATPSATSSLQREFLLLLGYVCRFLLHGLAHGVIDLHPLAHALADRRRHALALLTAERLPARLAAVGRYQFFLAEVLRPRPMRPERGMRALLLDQRLVHLR